MDELEVVEREDIEGGDCEGEAHTVGGGEEEREVSGRGARQGGRGLTKKEGAVHGMPAEKPDSRGRVRGTVLIGALLFAVGEVDGAPDLYLGRVSAGDGVGTTRGG